MNNIEILEDMIKDYENKIEHEYGFSDYYIQKIKKEKQAIENLIQENKELKEKNKILESLLQGNLFEMYKYYKELCNSYQGNSVSKDKIKEKIDKLEDIRMENLGTQYYGIVEQCENKIEVLQELLKGE